MNKKFFGAILFSAMILSSCTDEINQEIIPVLSQGDEVVFTMKPNLETRTMYSDDWGGMTAADWSKDKTQEIYWGNYISTQEDNIMIFCQQAARQVAKYKVDPQATDNATASGITKVDAAGIQWGKEGVDHQFYAFYPAQYYTEGSFTPSTDGSVTIRAKVDQGQSPVTYKAVVNNNTTSPLEGLAAINANSTADANHVTTIYGQPDMQSAIMMANTLVNGTPDEANQTGYGYPVGLDFNVLADVLDITINGPVTPNQLGGNASTSNPNGTPEKDIAIQNVQIVFKDATVTTPLSGNFDLTMKSDGSYSIANVSGSPMVQVQTTLNGVAPNLFARVNEESDVKMSDLDHLRLRAFLIPGQVKNLNELKLVIQTNRGLYEQELSDQEVENGKIHRISLKYFHQRAQSFDFTSWVGQLDPNIYVTELSIPGAWHAANSNYQATTDFTVMYNAGIRAFETHAVVKANGNSGYYAYIANGESATTTRLSTVFKTLGELIKTHGGEGFIVYEIGDPMSQQNFEAGVYAELEEAKDYIYQNEITAETTIGDVQGKIIVKINTNNANNEEEWPANTPALFSRWDAGTKGKASQIALQWGQPIEQTAESSMKWCFVEFDNINTGGGIATVEQAIEDLMTTAANNFGNGQHNIWYECGIGGYVNGSVSANNCKSAANDLNPWLYKKLTDSNRHAGPMGIILMNYATGSYNGTSGDYNSYNSEDLIRTIINNNSAFILQRKGGTSNTNPSTNNASDNTNSSYSNESRNPLK